MEAARDKLRQQTIQMPWTKVNRVDDDIRSNIWLRSVAGTISPEYQVTGRNNTSVVDWTLQQGTGNGDRFNTSVAIEAAGSYLNSERQAFERAFDGVSEFANIRFDFKGINANTPQDLLVRIENRTRGGGAHANTRLSWDGRYSGFENVDDQYYGELRVGAFVNPASNNSVEYEDYNAVDNEIRERLWKKGSKNYHTILHELGHVIGIDHTHFDRAGGFLFPEVSDNGQQDRGKFGLNSSLASVGSYRNNRITNERVGNNNPITPASSSETINIDDGRYTLGGSGLGYADTFGPLDITIMQKYYGMNTSHNSRNDTYVLPSNENDEYGWSTIWDTGGFDTIAAPDTNDPVLIDLRNANLLSNSTAAAGTYSRIKGDNPSGGLNIAYDWDGEEFGNDSEGINAGICVIEAGRGAHGSDEMIGNRLGNTFFGYKGNDEISLLKGNDIARGDIGDDVLLGGDGKDTLLGGSGNDRLEGGPGNDYLAGTQIDTLFGTRSTGGLRVTTAKSKGVIDTLVGGSGSDIFNLTAGKAPAYDSGMIFSSGREDHALIKDLDNKDTIQLAGNKSDYVLERRNGDTEIYLLARPIKFFEPKTERAKAIGGKNNKGLKFSNKLTSRFSKEDLTKVKDQGFSLAWMKKNRKKVGNLITKLNDPTTLVEMDHSGTHNHSHDDESAGQTSANIFKMPKNIKKTTIKKLGEENISDLINIGFTANDINSGITINPGATEIRPKNNELIGIIENRTDITLDKPNTVLDINPFEFI